MKKNFAILFLIIHLFNICGYRLLFSVIENSADKEMIALLDRNNYDENDLLQIKLALNTPYIQNSNSYERCDGEVEYHGIQYNYVKRIVLNDTLYLFCIPNQQKTNISKAKNSYTKQSADNTSGKASDQPILKKINFLSDYNSGVLNFNFTALQSSINQDISFSTITTLKGFTTISLQPPDLFI